MKTVFLFFIIMLSYVIAFSQAEKLSPQLKSEQVSVWAAISDNSALPALCYHPKKQTTTKRVKSADEISVVSVGTSANAYSYGYRGGQRSIVNVDNALGIITHNHRMGGELDPSGSSGDLGIDISYDQGNAWDCMIEIHEANIEIPGIYCNPVDVARYPSHGIFNPPGNTDPNEAYAVYFAPITWCIECATWGGYIFGTSKIGDPSITTKTMFCSDTAMGIHQNVPDGFCLNANGEFWAIDYNIHVITENWLHALILNRGSWDAQAEEYVLQQELLPCPTLTGDIPPPTAKIKPPFQV